MGWSIGDEYTNDLAPSYTNMHDLGKHLAHALPAKQWVTVSRLFNRRSGDPFKVQPRDAGRMAAVFRLAASHRLLPDDHTHRARRLADSAQRAADENRAWR